MDLKEFGIQHVAIIMDGNGRWANKRGLPRISGHQQGVRTVRKITEACTELNIPILTLYTFSVENWQRPISEVNALMKLLMVSLKKEVKNLMKNNIRFSIIGDIKKFDLLIQNQILDIIHKTKNNSGLNLNLALNYSSRQEIVYAARELASQSISGKININDIDENLFSTLLQTKDITDPDLLIRTGGEFRVSNFLLWQIAYTELHITDCYWPDFTKNNLLNAINEYQKRERRFGKINDKIQIKND